MILTPISNRLLQEKIDMQEAEKENLVNQIYDLRQLLKIVNEEGEVKVAYINKKNVRKIQNS
jgi:hypothetical protein